MRQRTSQILFAYWNEVRAGRLAPQRFDVEPARIASILPETFILECVNSHTFRYRLAGTRICEQLGYELRGSNFLDGWPEEDHITLERALATLVSQGAGLELVVEARPGRGAAARFELVLLPLLHTRQTVARIVGCISILQPEPAWLGSEPPTVRRIISSDLIWPDGRPHSVARAMARQSPFAPEMAGARIVQSARRTFRILDGGLSQKPLIDSKPQK